ncbi:MAG: hypothetical protein F4Z58_14510 [Acidimicrobiaceae bacterium]|nr:hypothetical protein [Acidimicrobiaceae bacterium]MXW77223.1 hypothetical protein [Acidimicrobiaceae bacterium]MYC42101.1 hypothetical protein [Acidimicrobiaceae bacterium]MYD06826.1 hypothetical protein [Acidimicrobiaceae bacterium]MYI57959.1 hypothetical protein [Acidimicrobiaceae bacterium]
MPNHDADEAARLLVIADRYFAQASAARGLAAAIDQRRISLTTRLDPCVRRHLPEVWSSNAAEVSRMRLTRMIARDIWVACEQLLETRTALIQNAEEAEAQAFVLQGRAAEINSTATNHHDNRSPDTLV